MTLHYVGAFVQGVVLAVDHFGAHATLATWRLIDFLMLEHL